MLTSIELRLGFVGKEMEIKRSEPDDQTFTIPNIRCLCLPLHIGAYHYTTIRIGFSPHCNCNGALKNFTTKLSGAFGIIFNRHLSVSWLPSCALVCWER